MLGAGFVGQMHSLAFRSAGFARAEPSVSANLVKVVDHDLALAREVADRYDWSGVGSEWSELENNNLDLFINAGPNDAHFTASAAAAQAGIAVFCEKPLASTADEAYELWKAVQTCGVMNRCAFIHRFIPALQLAREMVQAGELGDVRQFRSNFLLDMIGPSRGPTWRFDRGVAGSGATGDLGSHHIDVARFIVGEVTEVAAFSKTWTTDPSGRITALNDDAFVAIALLENGATAVFEASRVASAHNLSGRIEIDGTRASLSWSMERLNELVVREPGLGPRAQPVTGPWHPMEGFFLPGGLQGSHPLGWNECFAHEAHDILGLASGVLTESVAATFEDGYRVAEIVDAIEAAATSGSRVPVAFRS